MVVFTHISTFFFHIHLYTNLCMLYSEPQIICAYHRLSPVTEEYAAVVLCMSFTQ